MMGKTALATDKQHRDRCDFGHGGSIVPCPAEQAYAVRLMLPDGVSQRGREVWIAYGGADLVNQVPIEGLFSAAGNVRRALPQGGTTGCANLIIGVAHIQAELDLTGNDVTRTG